MAVEPAPHTYTEGTRICTECKRPWKVHRYNRNRTTCSEECSRALKHRKAIAYLQAQAKPQEDGRGKG